MAFPYLHDGYHAFVGDGVCPDGEMARGVSADNAVDGIPVGGVRLVPVHHRQIGHHNLHSVLRNFSRILQMKDRSGHGGNDLPSPLHQHAGWEIGPVKRTMGLQGMSNIFHSYFWFPIFFSLGIVPNLSKPSFTSQPKGEHQPLPKFQQMLEINEDKNLDILVQLQQSQS